MKKKILFGVLIVILLIIIIMVIIYLNNRIVDDNSGFVLKKDLTAEVYSKVDLEDYIKKIDGKIISKDKINTKKVGKKNVSFIYLNADDKKRRGTFEVSVVDTEKPLVWLSSSYRTPLGENIDLENDVMCVDNYDNNPSCRVKGDYDINTEGSYPLTFVAKDSSGNVYSQSFNLTVYNPDNISSEKQDVCSQTEEEIPVTNFSDVLNNYKAENTEVGIDVSKYQGDIDFTKVKNAGATFVMIRVGTQNGVGGDYQIDPYFEGNIKGALENGLKVGVYFYSYADSNEEARKQARWVIKQIKDYDVSLPVVFDFESFKSFNEMELSIFGLNEIADTFIKTIDDAGYNGVLYGSKSYLNSIWKYHTAPVWLAHYTDETDYTGDYFIWQMCDDGVIDGIDGYVDIDVLYKNKMKKS